MGSCTSIRIKDEKEVNVELTPPLPKRPDTSSSYRIRVDTNENHSLKIMITPPLPVEPDAEFVVIDTTHAPKIEELFLKENYLSDLP